jgi:hypothetical protein
MIPNHRPAYYSQPSFDSRGNNWEPRPQKIEDTLDRSEIQIDQKVFQLATKENDRGRFLRIVEHNGDRIESIMVPATGLKDFYAVFASIVEADTEFPPALTKDSPCDRT